MTPSPHPTTAARLTLDAKTAAEMMTPNPLSVRGDATMAEIIALLVDKGFGAAPVIDEAGRPIGVVSRSHSLAHERETRTRDVSPSADTPPGRGITTPTAFSGEPDVPARH